MNDNRNEFDNLNEPTKNEYIDKLTLEMFMNRTTYNKYLEKKDPTKYDRLQEYKMKLQKYMVDIVDITSQLIECPDRPPNGEIGEAFADYSKSIIKFFEMKELESPAPFYKNQNDDDVIFDPEKMTDFSECNNGYNVNNGNNDNQRFEKPKWSAYNVKKRYSNGAFL